MQQSAQAKNLTIPQCATESAQGHHRDRQQAGEDRRQREALRASELPAGRSEGGVGATPASSGLPKGSTRGTAGGRDQRGYAEALSPHAV